MEHQNPKAEIASNNHTAHTNEPAENCSVAGQNAEAASQQPVPERETATRVGQTAIRRSSPHQGFVRHPQDY